MHNLLLRIFKKNCQHITFVLAFLFHFYYIPLHKMFNAQKRIYLRSAFQRKSVTKTHLLLQNYHNEISNIKIALDLKNVLFAFLFCASSIFFFVFAFHLVVCFVNQFRGRFFSLKKKLSIALK